MIAQEPLTSVGLVFYRDRVEHWLRFGRDAGERILDRRRVASEDVVEIC